MEYIKQTNKSRCRNEFRSRSRACDGVGGFYLFPLLGAVVPRFRQTRGSVSPYWFAARAVVGRCLRSSLLKLLLLTRQAAEHGAVEPRRNELPSFRARRGLSIVPTNLETLADIFVHVYTN